MVRNIEVAVVSADAFRALSKPFLDSIGRDLNVCHSRAAENLGGMIASATSLALSVELYLKALRLRAGLKAEYTHDLLELFLGLPPEVQASVDSVYQGLEVPPDGVAVSLLLISKSKPEDKDPASNSADHSLTAVLGRCKDAFQTWRYLHERVGQVQTFSYEFHYLDNAAEAIRRHLGAVKPRIEYNQ